MIKTCLKYDDLTYDRQQVTPHPYIKILDTQL